MVKQRINKNEKKKCVCVRDVFSLDLVSLLCLHDALPICTPSRTALCWPWPASTLFTLNESCTDEDGDRRTDDNPMFAFVVINVAFI